MLINDNLKHKMSKTVYPISNTGFTISFEGIALLAIKHDGILGAALYVVNSTSHVFEYTKLFDSLTSYPIKLSSIDKSTTTFKVSWNTAGYIGCLIPLD